ncbi:hypothetical protein FRC96_03605 [Lujinxingia vulgaris]|uniref:Uncharacterized protein n=1 Tax=Lujinxingia vulgaris TaxID=2600176 RepID=A0A5C6XE74_9DELT|nr:hypothetical protein [Lujinxingia vulgaris]TXD41793.1 hypothetical protein FRC96_03605 [Lujinxingia vulgaris]
MGLLPLGIAACGGDDIPQDRDTAPPEEDATEADAGEEDAPETGVLSTGEFELPGTVTRLDVRGQGGEPQESYGLGHPIEMEVDVDPAPGWEERLDGFINVHVGLVAEIDSEDQRDEAETCYLGALHRPGKDLTVLEDGTYRYTRKYYIPDSCLDENQDRGTFNVWVALNPARFLPEEEGLVAIPREKYNTQFFNPLFDDTTGLNRNVECINASGETGCVHSIVLERAPGVNIITADTELKSDVFIFDPVVCDIPTRYSEPQAQVQTTLELGAHNEIVDTSSHEFDIFEHLNIDLPTLYFDICPQGDDGECKEGTSYMRMKVGSTNESGENVLVNEVQVSDLRAGVPHIQSANLYFEFGGEACMTLAGWNQAGEPDWSEERDFYLRVCNDTAFEESAPGADPDADNCVLRELRMVHIDDLPDGGEIASERTFTGGSSFELGNSILAAKAEFGSENHLDMQGASSDAYMNARVDGWVGFDIFDVRVATRSSIEGGDSGASGHLDVLGFRQWSASESGENVTLSDTTEFSERQCFSYFYGIAGVGLNASLCGEGSVGLEVQAANFRQEGAGPEPFDLTSRHGGVDQEIRPYSAFSMIATASVDIALARGGIEGTVNLVTAELPLASALNWGLDAPLVITTWDVTSDLVLTFFSGHIDVFVDLARPGWCGWYPCRKWASVVDERLVSFAGISSTYALLEQRDTSGVTLLDE